MWHDFRHHVPELLLLEKVGVMAVHLNPTVKVMTALSTSQSRQNSREPEELSSCPSSARDPLLLRQPFAIGSRLRCAYTFLKWQIDISNSIHVKLSRF